MQLGIDKKPCPTTKFRDGTLPYLEPLAANLFEFVEERFTVSMSETGSRLYVHKNADTAAFWFATRRHSLWLDFSDVNLAITLLYMQITDTSENEVEKITVLRYADPDFYMKAQNKIIDLVNEMVSSILRMRNIRSI